MEVQRLIEQRQAARGNRDWSESDRLRDQITALGWIVKDTPAGPSDRNPALNQKMAAERPLFELGLLYYQPCCRTKFEITGISNVSPRLALMPR